MKIAIACDSFKESLTAVEAVEAAARGVLRAEPRCEVLKIPVADGGEGTVDALVAATNGEKIEETVTGPLSEPVRASYGILGDGQTAVIEMASASGLPLVPPDRRNPLLTTTYGTGELIKSAVERGVSRIIVGIGGSATVDGGVGMAQALGIRFLDTEGREVGRGGGELKKIARIDMSGLDERVRAVSFDVACDVDNPLLGENGAARVYAPQKGATPEMVEELEGALANLADVIERDIGVDVRNMPGAGAAGGLGAGLVAFLGAKLKSGVQLVIEAVKLRDRIADCDLLITGEGRMDGQAIFGKAPVGVARVARELGIPVVALVGSIGDGCEKVLAEGIGAYFSIINRPMALEEAMSNAARLLTEAAEQAVRLFILGRIRR